MMIERRLASNVLLAFAAVAVALAAGLSGYADSGNVPAGRRITNAADTNIVVCPIDSGCRRPPHPG
jgi:hypothetical protein